jgi:hypothetical protein
MGRCDYSGGIMLAASRVLAAAETCLSQRVHEKHPKGGRARCLLPNEGRQRDRQPLAQTGQGRRFGATGNVCGAWRGIRK